MKKLVVIIAVCGILACGIYSKNPYFEVYCGSHFNGMSVKEIGDATRVVCRDGRYFELTKEQK